MEISQSRTFIFISVICLAIFTNSSHCATVVVNGVSQWKDPTVYIGDSIIFKDRDDYALYIFRNKIAFNLCNFTQANPLTSLNSSSYTWNPSRLGTFFFSFSNGTEIPCKDGQKWAIQVIETPAPANSAEPPTAGGVVSSSPAFPWPFQPREKSGGAPAPSTVAMGPEGSMPLIDSSPAVPLPTGEVDSATIRPLPTSADDSDAVKQVQMEGLFGLVILQCIAILLMV